jgi:hypothetical protein
MFDQQFEHFKLHGNRRGIAATHQRDAVIVKCVLPARLPESLGLI